jgi:hypothetical protein
MLRQDTDVSEVYAASIFRVMNLTCISAVPHFRKMYYLSLLYVLVTRYQYILSFIYLQVNEANLRDLLTVDEWSSLLGTSADGELM